MWEYLQGYLGKGKASFPVLLKDNKRNNDDVKKGEKTMRIPVGRLVSHSASQYDTTV